MKSSLDSKLQIGYICSIRILSRNWDIVENRCSFSKLIFNIYVLSSIKNFSFRIFENNFPVSKHSALGYFPSISKCGVCFAWPLMKESKDQASNGKCENAIKDELAGAHDKPKSQNIVRRKSNLPQVILKKELKIISFEILILRI